MVNAKINFPVSDLISNKLFRSLLRPLQVGLRHSQFVSRSRRLELDRAGFIFDFESMVLKQMNLASFLQDLFLPDVLMCNSPT
jgi:hypothetical protein